MGSVRYDVAELKGVERTPQGGLRVAANLTRTGVFSYVQPDGSVRRELRHPDDVFNPKSLETYKSAPVTDLHPPMPVTPENYKDLNRGHVGEDVKPDGQFVASHLTVQDADLVKAIEAKQRREISMGYTADLVAEAGEYNGEKYDARQTNIVINHCALGPAGWGRAGSDVSLRLDSNGDQVISLPREDSNMKCIRIDGVDYEVGSDAHLAKLDSVHKADLAKAVDAEKTRADAAEQTIKRLDEAAVADKKLVAAEKARADKAEGELKAALEPKALHGRVQSRLVVVDSFRAVSRAAQKREPDEAKRKVRADADEAKAAGSSDIDLMLEVVKAYAPDFDSTDENEIRGAFKLVIKKTMGAAEEAPEVDEYDAAGAAEMPPPGAAPPPVAPAQRGDSVYDARRGREPRAGAHEKPLTPEQRMRKDSEERWQKPLSTHRA